MKLYMKLTHDFLLVIKSNRDPISHDFPDTSVCSIPLPFNAKSADVNLTAEFRFYGPTVGSVWTSLPSTVRDNRLSLNVFERRIMCGINSCTQQLVLAQNIFNAHIFARFFN